MTRWRCWRPRSEQGCSTDWIRERFALKSLRFIGLPRDAIRYFWDGASGEKEIARSQLMNAALNRIRLILEGKRG